MEEIIIMKKYKTPEELSTHVLNSIAAKKIALTIAVAGIAICLISSLSPVQNLIFLFVDEHISHKGSGGNFDSRLISLLTLPFIGLLFFVFLLCCLFSKNIAVFFENEKNNSLIISVGIGFNIFLLGFISILSYRYGWQWLNSDHSSEMVLGKLLAQENTFISSNWHYSTEIRLIYQTLFSMPLFKLFGNADNWALIRALVILLNNAVLIFSYFFMMKQMKVRTKWMVITSLFLLLPVSIGYWDIVTFGGYYTFFIAQFFCVIGLFIRLLNNTDAEKLPGITFIIFSIISFLLGIQGIRSLLSIFIPLLITSLYLWSKMQNKKIFPLFLGCYSFIICCIGFVVNYLLLFKYKFHSFDNMHFTDLWIDFLPKLGQSIVSLAVFFGLSAGDSLLSAAGMLNVIAIIGTVILFLAVFRSHTLVQKTEHKYLTILFAVSVLFNIFIFIIVDEDITARYFIPFMILYIPLTAVFLNHVKTFYYLKYTAVICGVILFIFGQSYIHFQDLSRSNFNNTRKGYIQYLADNQLNFGFATYWNANVTTELSNGKVQMVGLESLNPIMSDFSIHHWLTPVQFSDPLYYQGEAFLLINRFEWEKAYASDKPFVHFQPDYEDENYIIIRYPSAQIIHDEILD